MSLNCEEKQIDNEGTIINKKCGLNIAFGQPVDNDIDGVDEKFSSIYMVLKNAISVQLNK